MAEYPWNAKNRKDRHRTRRCAQAQPFLRADRARRRQPLTGGFGRQRDNRRSSRVFAAMRRFFLAVVLILLAPFAHAVQELRGTTPGGAAYVMAVPDGWQPGGKLVFVNHGFEFELDDDPGLGPLRDVQ